VLLLAKAFEADEPIKRLRDGITIDGKQFQFDAAGALYSQVSVPYLQLLSMHRSRALLRDGKTFRQFKSQTIVS
jgi:hypothetical protein